jgi:hypothetical protein
MEGLEELGGAEGSWEKLSGAGEGVAAVASSDWELGFSIPGIIQ